MKGPFVIMSENFGLANGHGLVRLVLQLSRVFGDEEAV